MALKLNEVFYTLICVFRYPKVERVCFAINSHRWMLNAKRINNFYRRKLKIQEYAYINCCRDQRCIPFSRISYAPTYADYYVKECQKPINMCVTLSMHKTMHELTYQRAVLMAHRESWSRDEFGMFFLLCSMSSFGSRREAWGRGFYSQRQPLRRLVVGTLCGWLRAGANETKREAKLMYWATSTRDAVQKKYRLRCRRRGHSQNLIDAAQV